MSLGEMGLADTAGFGEGGIWRKWRERRSELVSQFLLYIVGFVIVGN